MKEIISQLCAKIAGKRPAIENGGRYIGFPGKMVQAGDGMSSTGKRVIVDTIRNRLQFIEWRLTEEWPESYRKTHGPCSISVGQNQHSEPIVTGFVVGSVPLEHPACIVKLEDFLLDRMSEIKNPIEVLPDRR